MRPDSLPAFWYLLPKRQYKRFIALVLILLDN